MKMYLAEAEKPTHSKSINQRYLDYLKKLPSDQLSLVVEAHKKNKIRRKPLTVHAIMDELFERSANPDSKEKI